MARRVPRREREQREGTEQLPTVAGQPPATVDSSSVQTTQRRAQVPGRYVAQLCAHGTAH